MIYHPAESLGYETQRYPLLRWWRRGRKIRRGLDCLFGPDDSHFVWRAASLMIWLTSGGRCAR
jgi:hypothetical protein